VDVVAVEDVVEETVEAGVEDKVDETMIMDVAEVGIVMNL
jgi:hypothetical protein